ncbi:MAG: hypothetical protein ABII72_02750, partial [Parcubacteria group bacterium]
MTKQKLPIKQNSDSLREKDPTLQDKDQKPEVGTKPKRRKKLVILFVILGVVILIAGALAVYFLVIKKQSEEEKEITLEDILSQEGDTSFDLIDKALEEGKIDKETSLVYGAYAAFDDGRLPEEYRSDIRAFEANKALWGLRENYDSLSTENKKIADPFLKRPDEEGSWWNQKVVAAAPGSKSIKTAQAARPKGSSKLS